MSARTDPESYRDRDLHELHVDDEDCAAEPEFSDFQAEMLNTLSSGGSVKITPQRGSEGMAAEQQAAMEELVAMGLARKSASGRYWAPDSGSAGRPEIGEPVNVRLGGYLPQVDEFAAGHGMTRAAAIRELVSRGMGHVIVEKLPTAELESLRDRIEAELERRDYDASDPAAQHEDTPALDSAVVGIKVRQAISERPRARGERGAVLSVAGGQGATSGP